MCVGCVLTKNKENNMTPQEKQDLELKKRREEEARLDREAEERRQSDNMVQDVITTAIMMDIVSDGVLDGNMSMDF